MGLLDYGYNYISYNLLKRYVTNLIVFFFLRKLLYSHHYRCPHLPSVYNLFGVYHVPGSLPIILCALSYAKSSPCHLKQL